MDAPVADRSLLNYSTLLIKSSSDNNYLKEKKNLGIPFITAAEWHSFSCARSSTVTPSP